MLSSTSIEVPFHLRRDCWFCGEPQSQLFIFPHDRHLVTECIHPQLSLPTCSECFSIAGQAKSDSIWLVASFVKKSLHKKYHKDLAIGIHWTQEELAQSEFENGNFAGFQKSAWFMYEVAKQRVNYKGYPLIFNGIALDENIEKDDFVFDGVSFPCLDTAILYYCDVYRLNIDFFKQVVHHFGRLKFADAVRFCRLYVGSTPQERTQALNLLLV